MCNCPLIACKPGGRIFLRWLIAASIVGATFYSLAADTVTKTETPPKEAEKITADNVNLSVQQFFKSYTSNSAEERKAAEIYLLGVIDATEGTVWCDYRTFKTDTLRERIFIEFKKLDERQSQARASKMIAGVLAKRYPCGKRKQ